MTSSKSARRARRAGRRRPQLDGDFPDTGEAVTEILNRVKPASYDGTTIAFGGAADVGLNPGQVYAQADPAAGLKAAIELTAMADRAPAPAPRLRVAPPPPARPVRYATAATGPQPVISRLSPAIGDALARDETWGPKLAPQPCGHCGTPPGVPDGILERTRVIGYVNWRAREAGWTYDTDLIWTCRDCQDRDEWKARQGQMEVRASGTCLRHDWNGHAGADCTCPGAVLAVDVMLASEDHLGSGHGRPAGGAR